MMIGQLKPSASDEFVTWLEGYLAGVQTGYEMGSRPPAHLERIFAKLAELKAPKPVNTVTIRAPGMGGFATGGEIGPQTRRAIGSLEARR